MNISEKALQIVQQTREILLPFYGNAEAVDHKSASPHDVVTKLDRDVETFLSRELQKIDSAIAFAGEEFGGNRDEERFWLCDPIDGTAHFIRGLPFCTVMLALIEGGQVNFSAIFDFVNNDMYHATRGGGAFKNEERIHVSGRPATDMYLGWETHADKKENNERFLKLRERAVLFKSLSAGYEYVLVATGKLEGRVNFDPYGKDWDFAPGSLLVEEAGGVVANLGKRTYDFRNLDFIAGNKAVHEVLTEGPDAIFPTSN